MFTKVLVANRGEIEGTGDAVQEGDAIQQQTGGQRAEDEITDNEYDEIVQEIAAKCGELADRVIYEDAS